MNFGNLAFGKALSALLFFGWVGCAGHAHRTKTARDALDQGSPWAAVNALNEELGVEKFNQQPKNLDDDDSLLLLDRAVILEGLGQYNVSSADYQTADKHVEVLDFSRDALDSLGRYLYSDDSGPYQAPAYEKLLINTLNMLNYLARGDLSGARVEARRFAVMQKFVKEHMPQSPVVDSFGNYIAGFVYEMSGELAEARSYYTAALGSQADGIWKEQINNVLAELGKQPTCKASQGCGTLLIAAGVGRVAPKVARRIPIGLALTYASGYLSPYNSSRAGYLAGQGLVTWVSYPELGRPVAPWGAPIAYVDSHLVSMYSVEQIDTVARRSWNQARGAVIASAITRMITRVVAGETTRQAVGGVAGALISLAGQAALTVTDTPDTRSWSTLPAVLYLSRTTLPAGKHEVYFDAQGMRQKRALTMRKGGFASVPFFVLR